MTKYYFIIFLFSLQFCADLSRKKECHEFAAAVLLLVPRLWQHQKILRIFCWTPAYHAQKKAWAPSCLHRTTFIAGCRCDTCNRVHAHLCRHAYLDETFTNTLCHSVMTAQFGIIFAVAPFKKLLSQWMFIVFRRCLLCRPCRWRYDVSDQHRPSAVAALCSGIPLPFPHHATICLYDLWEQGHESDYQDCVLSSDANHTAYMESHEWTLAMSHWLHTLSLTESALLCICPNLHGRLKLCP